MQKMRLTVVLFAVLCIPSLALAEAWKDVPKKKGQYYDAGSIVLSQDKAQVETRIQMANDGSVAMGCGYQSTVLINCKAKTVRTIHTMETCWGVPNPPKVPSGDDDREIAVLKSNFKELYGIVCPQGDAPKAAKQ